ncbi:hypothetical protein QFZ80_002769 [Paenibacillus sp. V4I7]|nr:hypothetical protein [Paenibacillus sp. V4I7]MDQ0915074.1 hypothetical protein [Paenibacillus sp. V4I5]
MGLSTNEKRLVKNLMLKKDLFIIQRIVYYFGNIQEGKSG